MATALTALIFALPGIALAETSTATQAPQPRPTSATAALVPAPQSVQPAEDTAESAVPSPQITGPQRGSVTGFPIPRFVSIKASEANVRRGPSRSHRIDWVFQRRNMPVMVVAEHGHWRRIIDRDGAGGWVHYTLLSGERTAIVTAEMLPIYTRPDTGATIRARAERDVIAELRQCQTGWCEIEAGGFRGWVAVSGLWGVDPDEQID
ncbi:SH3 domain-containing protein [Roseicyclus sp.]|uniref:SH3 domain-containing protein n=1 Tax=Roseicyclus sp. TaxID=1914329 RepID=UPI003F6B7303